MTQTSRLATIDEAKLGAFMGKVVSDLGALISAGCVIIGDKLGPYRAMADGAPVTSGELAKRASTTERYVREWLVNSPSIDRARHAAAEAGVADRVEFHVAGSEDFPGDGYDMVAFFDCFHDLGNPAGSARRAYETLAQDGKLMIVEPMAGNAVEENLNPVGRVYSGASVLCCTPNALAYGGHALGTIATDAALGEMVLSGGFTQFRRATESSFNRVFEGAK